MISVAGTKPGGKNSAKVSHLWLSVTELSLRPVRVCISRRWQLEQRWEANPGPPREGGLSYCEAVKACHWLIFYFNFPRNFWMPLHTYLVDKKICI